MGKILFIIILMACPVLLSAQGKRARAILPKETGLGTITREYAESVIGFLASDELEGRESGYAGSFIASRYLASELRKLGVAPLMDKGYFQEFEAYSMDRQKSRRFSVNPDSIQKWSDGVHRVLRMRNVLGMIAGERSDEYVVIGAHLDHLGKDENLSGDKIYNGADDNASGVSAVLQIAKAFVASGRKPLRNVIFAFWDGEERGLLGSEYFVANCNYIGKVKGYLNFDMIGRDNKKDDPKYLVYFYTASHPAFGDWLRNDINTYSLGLNPDIRAWDNPVGGSDNGSFAKRGVPILWYHTDGHEDYHAPGDHVDKINWPKLVDITKASYLNAWNLANDESY